MFKKLFQVPFRLLDSVVFGIAIMALTGLFIAVGSGLPGVRELLEMNEMRFFNSWPLKLLMTLLVASLTTVTIRRIPFTPPRYGVWMIHSGIVVLIFGLAWYYRMKVEGLALVPVHGSAANFYDSSDRMLYIRVADDSGAYWQEPALLDKLPRFAAYGPELGNSHKLKLPAVPVRAANQPKIADVSIVGYYPYANILSSVEEDASSNPTGVKVAFRDPISGQLAGGRYLLDEGMTADVQRIEPVRRVARVRQVPPQQRDRDEGAAGARQVLLVKITREGWVQTVALPFSAYAGEAFQPWSEPINIPGTRYRLAMKFGNAMMGLPAILGLEKFNVVSYPGGSAQLRMQRDFQSTLRVEDVRTGKQQSAVVKLNAPMYYTDSRGMSWLFFQSGWDQEGVASGQGARWTIIGVGNRSGIAVMTTGATMMGVGLLYAFYLKPILLRQMKRRALAMAETEKRGIAESGTGLLGNEQPISTSAEPEGR